MVLRCKVHVETRPFHLKKVVLAGIRRFELTESPKPGILNSDDVLLKVDSVGVCGSDLHYFNEGKIGDQIIHFPFAIGHECSAKVEEVGENVRRVKRGDLVAIDPCVSCGGCEQCKRGREHTCLNQKFLGSPGQMDGCLSEYIVMPERNCFPVPENVKGEQAALVEPLSIGYYSTQFLENVDRTDSIVVLGAGPIGLGVVMSLQAKGFNQIYATDKLDYRLLAAEKAGAIWTGNPDKEEVVAILRRIHPQMFDAVIECCGRQEGLDQGIDLLRPGGVLLVVGIPEFDRISFDISKLRRKEITIQNVRRQNRTVQPVIDLISAGKWSLDFIITHHFSLGQTYEAFDTVSNYKDGVIKAMIRL